MQEEFGVVLLILSLSIISRVFFERYLSKINITMSSTPGAPPPGGDENIGYKLVIVASTTIATCAITILLRMYVRARIVRAVGWDDWLMLLALVNFLYTTLLAHSSLPKYRFSGW